MVDSPSHQEFLQRMDEGHLSALAELAEGRFGYAERLLEKAETLIGRKLGKTYGPDDAVGSVFRVLSQEFGKGNRRFFKHSGALRNFLATILRRRIATRGGTQFPADSLPSAMDLTDSLPDRNLAALEARDLVFTAMQELSFKEQQICRLYAELLSELAVSKHLGCSRRTVHRALERFAWFVAQRSGQSTVCHPTRQKR
jgi:hypothetical protein